MGRPDSDRLQPVKTSAFPNTKDLTASMAGQHELETLTAALARESGFAPFAGPDAAILIWDASVERIVWASPAAATLRDVLTRDGLIDPSLAARARLEALADGLAPRQGMRLERLRLDPTRLVPRGPFFQSALPPWLEQAPQLTVLSLSM